MRRFYLCTPYERLLCHIVASPVACPNRCHIRDIPMFFLRIQSYQTNDVLIPNVIYSSCEYYITMHHTLHRVFLSQAGKELAKIKIAHPRNDSPAPTQKNKRAVNSNATSRFCKSRADKSLRYSCQEKRTKRCVFFCLLNVVASSFDVAVRSVS